jgi:hypothetical protein
MNPPGTGYGSRFPRTQRTRTLRFFFAHVPPKKQVGKRVRWLRFILVLVVIAIVVGGIAVHVWISMANDSDRRFPRPRTSSSNVPSRDSKSLLCAARPNVA